MIAGTAYLAVPVVLYILFDFFVIDEEHKLFYYRGLAEWKNEKGSLTDTCLSAQDKFKEWLDYFRIKYEN